MKLRKLWALLLAVSLVMTMMLGCGKEEVVSEDPTTGSPDKATPTADAGEPEEEEMAEIEVVILSLGPSPQGAPEVEAAINEITEAEINTHVTLNYIDVGSYAQQTSLMISGNEKMDLMLTSPIQAASFSSMTAQNQLLPLDDLLKEYAPELLSTVGEYIEGTRYNGKIHGVPTFRALNSNAYLVMRADILNELGLMEKAKNLSSWTEYEEILSQVVEKTDLTGISQNDGDGTVITLQNAWLDQDKFADNTGYDNLGDNYKLIAVDENTDKVFSYFGSDKYKATLERVRSWYEKGYVYKDAATSEEMGDNLIKNNVTFSICVNSEIGVEASRKGSTGYEVVAPVLLNEPISTGSCTKFTWAVPVTATEKEAAVKFMNLMYTRAEIANLLTWGIEGRDYVVVDGQAQYPDGVDASTVPYHTPDFLYGNQFLVYPWQGQGADFRTVAKADMDAAGASKYLGFTCDATGVSNELTALMNVIAEYKPALESGSVDLSVYEEFKNKMQAAGIEKVVNEYQTQLDAWLAGQ